MEEQRNKKDLEMERREERRKRRQRNQIIVYTVMLLLVALTAFGVVSLVSAISNRNTEQEVEQQQSVQDSTQSALDELVSTEEELPPVSQEVVELTPEQKLDEIVNAAIEVMPIEDKIAGLFFVSPESITGVKTVTKAGEGTKTALEKYAVGGIVYQAKNIKDADQFKEMLNNTELWSKYRLFLGVEQDLGDNGPLVEKGLMETTLTPKELAATGDAAVALSTGDKLGESLSSYGLNVNFAPLADLSGEKGYLDGAVYLSDNVVLNSAFSTGLATGMKNQGVIGCLKYFPGSGSAKKVAEGDMIHSEQSLEDFMTKDFEMYRNAIASGVDMIMVGSFSAEALTGDRTPCALSQTVVTEYLRGELGYQGIIVTDFLNQKSITSYYESDVAAVMALKAGCDMLLAPEDFEKAYQGVKEAVDNGSISVQRIDDALRRIYRVKFADRVQ